MERSRIHWPLLALVMLISVGLFADARKDMVAAFGEVKGTGFANSG